MSAIIACGLLKEARLIARAGGAFQILAGGGNSAELDRRLDVAAQQPGTILLSCGIAGGLRPGLRPGDVVIDGDAAFVTRLTQALPGAHVGAILGGDEIVATARQKRALAASTGALAVDMESHIVRGVARRWQRPFGAVRVVSDRAEDDLPRAALVGMNPDGSMALGAVLAALAANPMQLPALIRTGRQASAAFRSLAQAMAAVTASGLDRLDAGTLSPA